MPSGRRGTRIGTASAVPIATCVAAMLALAFFMLPATVGSATASTGGGGGLCPVFDLVPPLACRAAGDERATATPAPSASAEQGSTEVPDSVLRTSTTVRHDPGRIAVTVKRGATRRRIDAAFAKAGVTVEESIPQIRAYMVGIEPSRADFALKSLRASSAVATVGQEVLADALDLSPNDADWPEQWGLRVTRFPQAWSLVKSGANSVVVAVLDTGVDPSQPDLRGALIPGYDFVHQTTNPADDHGHGTAVAGIIAARIDNREGIAGTCAICVIMPVKVLDSGGVGDDSVIAAGIVWAADHGAKVINLSL